MSVKATEEELTLIKVVLVSVLQEAQKTGWSWKDLPAFLKSPSFEAALLPAVADAAKVPSELTSLSLVDDVELAKFVYGMAEDIVGELKKVKGAA